MMSEDYEALGRYTAATEQAHKAARDRREVLQRLDRYISSALRDPSGLTLAMDIDVEKMRELLDEAAGLNQKLHAAVHEANIHAEACHKPKLQIEESKYSY